MKADDEGSPAGSGIPSGHEEMFFANQRYIMQHTSIRVGQRLMNWDGTRGYVALNSQGKGVFGPRESFLVELGTLEEKALGRKVHGR